MGIMQSGSENSPQRQGYQPHICFIYLFIFSAQAHADAEPLDALAGRICLGWKNMNNGSIY